MIYRSAMATQDYPAGYALKLRDDIYYYDDGEVNTPYIHKNLVNVMTPHPVDVYPEVGEYLVCSNPHLTCDSSIIKNKLYKIIAVLGKGTSSVFRIKIAEDITSGVSFYDLTQGLWHIATKEEIEDNLFEVGGVLLCINDFDENTFMENCFTKNKFYFIKSLSKSSYDLGDFITVIDDEDDNHDLRTSQIEKSFKYISPRKVIQALEYYASNNKYAEYAEWFLNLL